MNDPLDNDDLSVLYEQYATHIQPIVTQTDNHTWRAQYPDLDWHVTADSKEAAAEELSKEALRRHDAGEPDAQPPHDLLKRHLERPIAGVYAMDRELFLYLRSHAGNTETQHAFEEAERHRAAGRPYTKSEYLQDKSSRSAT